MYPERIFRSWGIVIFNFTRRSQIALQSDCINLHPYHQYIRISAAPHFCPIKRGISFSFLPLHSLSFPHFPVQIKTRRLHPAQLTQDWNLHLSDSKTFPPPEMPTLPICSLQKKQNIRAVFRSRANVRNHRKCSRSWADSHGNSPSSQAAH